MSIKLRDEEKRSKAWIVVMLISSILIILAIVFFITKSVFGNPLEGEWYSQENELYLEVDDENEATLEGTFGDAYVEVELTYSLNKNDKTITIKPRANAYAEAAADAKGTITAIELQEILDEMMTSYDYSLERGTLTLTEREYAEQLIFTRVK